MDPSARERRQLDGFVDSLFGGDLALVRASLPQIEQAGDARRRTFVLGAIDMFERRTHDAVNGLSTISGMVDDDIPVQHRVETLLAWTRLNVGAPETEIQEALDRAGALRAEHPGIIRLGLLASAQVLARHAEDPDSLPGLAALPENPHAVAPESTSLLAWRGSVRSNTGRFAAAIPDLLEVLDRMQRGLHEFSAGAFHSQLARAQWFSGDWPQAGVNLRLAMELSGEVTHPLVLPVVPLPMIGAGDLGAADAAIEVARRAVQRTPWPEAIDQLMITELIRAHAAEPAPVAGFGLLADQVRGQIAGEYRKSVIWNLHVGLAAVLSGEPKIAATCSEFVKRAAGRAHWAAPMASWLRGLTAEMAGDGRSALGHLRNAAGADLSTIPLYSAHVLVDQARLAHLMGDPAAAQQSLDTAASTYQRLGAVGYLSRVDALRRDEPLVATAPTLGLSDRERDVLTLVSAGLSYAQIARDLFITQSTVSYHLGNIYAKANVKSRHQLTALVRTEPAMFGLAH
jgi:DNA-binding CsgD family transcriptional regulator